MRGSPGSLGQGVPHHQTLLHLPELAEVFAQPFCNHTPTFEPARAPRPSPPPRRPLPPVTPARPGRPRASQPERPPVLPPHTPPALTRFPGSLLAPTGAPGSRGPSWAGGGTAPAGFPPLREPPHKSLSRRCERSWRCRRRVPGAQPTPRCPRTPHLLPSTRWAVRASRSPCALGVPGRGAKESAGAPGVSRAQGRAGVSGSGALGGPGCPAGPAGAPGLAHPA